MRSSTKAVLIATFMLLAASPAPSLAGVSDPGPFTARITGGTLAIGETGRYSLNNATGPITVSGTVDADGALRVPREAVNFPPIPVVGSLTASVVPTADITGHLDPETGLMNVDFKVMISITGADAPAGCSIGSPEQPISLSSLTSRFRASSPKRRGYPYDPTKGTVTLVDNKATVPASTGCGPDFTPLVDGALHLPSPSGANTLRMTVVFSPAFHAVGPVVSCAAPRVVGKSTSKASALLRRAHCRLGSVTKRRRRGVPGTVIAQAYKPGTRLEPGERINVTVIAR